MSKRFDITKFGVTMTFSIDEDGRLLILGVSDKEGEEYIESDMFPALEIHISGTNPAITLGVKHKGESLPYVLKYVSHEETDDELVFTLESGLVRAKLHYVFYEDAKVVRSYSEVENVSGEDIGLEYISSFALYGFKCPSKVYIPHSAWCQEANWREYTPWELGFNPIFKEHSTKRITISNTGSWSTKEYLPMGALKSEDKTMLWQIESNGSWQWEFSDIGMRDYYLKLSGPTEQENHWWKVLAPGEKFETVKAALTVVTGGFDDAVFEMNKYRKHIAYRSPADVDIPVIFNDYMGCLWSEPTTEKEIPVIDAAARVGADIYCMDAGWYAKLGEKWWGTVGEWKPSLERFPNGMNEVFDYIRSKGMRPGIWLEPEVMGIDCPAADKFEDECFFMRHGKKAITRGRYHFDFRNKKVRDYLDGIVDGLIKDYGIEYFKFDYNIDGGYGTEVDADSFGDGLLQNNDAFLSWIDGLYERHPNLIIENCGSGAMRMDYKTLSHFSLQSMSDAESYRDTAAIATMANTAVIPEQAGVWCIPKDRESVGEIAYNVVNCMFKRIQVSGKTHLLNDEQFAVLKEGVDFFKTIRERIPYVKASYPCGLITYDSPWTCVGYEDERNGDKFLCVGRIEGEDTLKIPVGKVSSAEIVYPKANDARIELCECGLKVTMPKKCAVVIKIN